MTASSELQDQRPEKLQEPRDAGDAEKGLQAQTQPELRGSCENARSNNNDEELERWNSTPRNIAKTLATFWAFLVMGANDSAYGVSFYLAASC